MVRRKKDFLESNDPLETSHNREVWDKRSGMVPKGGKEWWGYGGILEMDGKSSKV